MISSSQVFADLTLEGGRTKMKTVKDELLDVVYM